MSEAWWVIHSDDLRHALHRVAEGDDPDLVYTELYVTSYRERPAQETP